MIETTTLSTYLDELLQIARIPDYAGALNGLQLDNNGTVTKIAASVDFSSRSVVLAIEDDADFLLVHHGMFWGGAQRITGSRFSRLRSLIESNVAVYSSHLPLDCHSEFGNNMLLSRQLGLNATGEFARYKTIPIGLSGEAEVPTVQIVERTRQFAAEHGGEVVTTRFSPDKVTHSWAMCTGAGASAETLSEAVTLGIDTLIVGEGPHWTAVEAEDAGITIIYAGHYATETLGVRALAKHVAEKFGLDWTQIHVPTGL